jgi:hypothetical protein
MVRQTRITPRASLSTAAPWDFAARSESLLNFPYEANSI